MPFTQSLPAGRQRRLGPRDWDPVKERWRESVTTSCRAMTPTSALQEPPIPLFHPTERNAMNENTFVADELPATPDLIRAALWDRRTATRQLAERWAERLGTTSTTVDASAAHDDPKDA